MDMKVSRFKVQSYKLDDSMVLVKGYLPADPPTLAENLGQRSSTNEPRDLRLAIPIPMIKMFYHEKGRPRAGANASFPPEPIVMVTIGHTMQALSFENDDIAMDFYLELIEAMLSYYAQDDQDDMEDEEMTPGIN